MTTSTTLRKLAVDWEMLEESSARPRYWRHHDFLDTETGEVVFLDEETFRKVGEGAEHRLLAPWQQEDVPLAKQVLNAPPGRYVHIPVPGDDCLGPGKGWGKDYDKRRVRKYLTDWMRSELGIEPIPPRRP